MATKRFSSVRWRATIGASLILAIALVVGALAASSLLRSTLASDAESQLVDRVGEVQLLIDHHGLTPVLLPTGREVGQVQVIAANDNVVAVTPGLAGTTRLDVIDAPALGEQTTATVDGGTIGGIPGQQYRMVARTVDSEFGPLTIYAVTSLDSADRAQSDLRNSLIIGVPILVALTAFVIYRVVARALAPVDSMRAEVDRIEATDLSGRVEPGSSDDEIANLGLTLNRMLDRLETESRRQQLFAAAASHELRSPLSTIRTELEVGLAYPDRAEWTKVAEDSLIEVARLEDLTRDLRMLTRSRSMQASAAVSIELSELVASEVSLRRPERGVRYQTSLEPARLMADPDAVVRVIRNLFDNAERHAAGEVRVAVSEDQNGIALVVGNDGPEIPDADRERIFEPFMRLDEARSLDIGGSGLGLAIARSIMTALGGSIVALPVDHGAQFKASFPSAPIPS